MIKNCIKIIFLVSLFFMLFCHSTKTNTIYAYDNCDNGCSPSYCGCEGSCWGGTSHEECSFTDICDCTELGIEYWGCTYTFPCNYDCWLVEIPGSCYYNASCYLDCLDYACSDWLCGSCTDDVKCCYCQDAGNYGYSCTSCSSGPDDPSPIEPTSTCSVSLSPKTLSLSAGTTATITATVTSWTGDLQNVNFTSSDTNVGTINPSLDSDEPYSTDIASIDLGNTTITANVTVSGAVRCSDTVDVLVTPPGPWWQTKNGDIASGGDLTSIIPPATSNKYLILDGNGGFPGVAFYTKNLHLGFGTTSSKNWIVNSSLTNIKSYNYYTLAKRIPSDVIINPITNNSITQTDLLSTSLTEYKGYYWLKYDGDISGANLSIDSDINLIGRKIVLLVEGSNLNINGKINLAGTGFFTALVGENSNGEGGNILINSSVGGISDEVPELEGIFLTDNLVKTGIGNTQLHIRGSVASLGGIVLERDLDDNSHNPAEFFEFAPDLILLFPSQLNIKEYQWKEIAP